MSSPMATRVYGRMMKALGTGPADSYKETVKRNPAVGSALTKRWLVILAVLIGIFVLWGTYFINFHAPAIAGDDL